MDGSRFDGLARAMHASPSRRRFLGGLAGVTAAAVAGRVGFDDALAQQVEGSAFDLTCRNRGTRSFCFDEDPIDSCGPNSLSCKCARTRKGKKRVCIEQPRGGCPTRRTRCRNENECGQNEECITVRACCPGNPSFGTCALRCDEQAGSGSRDGDDRDAARRRRRRRRDNDN